MKRILSWNITKEQEGMTVEEFLRTRGCSHHVLTHLKRTECGISKNGIWAYTNQILQNDDILQIQVIENDSSANIRPVSLPLDIVYEDEDLMIVNKPKDMPIHPSINNHENTLANAVMYYFSSQNIPFVYRCINRLDRDTSGLLIIAKNMLSGAILSRMSASRQIHREYLAIVEGCLPESGTIDAPIARQEASAIMRCVDLLRGETAVTHYHRLSWLQDNQKTSGLSLAAIRLETGRTHQIRVHMKHIGHPLIGDFLYNPGSKCCIGRQALHSHRLDFIHPVTGEAMSFTCGLPEDMNDILTQYGYTGT